MFAEIRLLTVLAEATVEQAPCFEDAHLVCLAAVDAFKEDVLHQRIALSLAGRGNATARMKAVIQRSGLNQQALLIAAASVVTLLISEFGVLATDPLAFVGYAARPPKTISQ